MLKLGSLLAASTALVAISANAHAQEWSGFYAGAHVGYTDGEARQPYGNVGGPFVFHNQDAPDVSGAIGGVQLGYDLNFADRWVLGFEVQGDWGNRKGDDGGTGGDVNGVKINNEYSARLRAGYLLWPSTLLYATGGYVAMDVDATAPTTGKTNETVEGWTYGLGIEHKFADHWSSFIEARHDDMRQERFSFPADGYDEGITPRTDSVRLGINYRFGGAQPAPVVEAPQPPPPPPPMAAAPAPAACPTSDFVVYFEWDRSNLNQAALDTIDSAASRARQCNVSGIVVVGHTDTSGSTQYNEGLSERRASVVRDALTARGIEAGSVETQARGETDLARQTRDGVREPLNRRTAVTISFR